MVTQRVQARLPPPVAHPMSAAENPNQARVSLLKYRRSPARKKRFMDMRTNARFMRSKKKAQTGALRMRVMAGMINVMTSTTVLVASIP